MIAVRWQDEPTQAPARKPQTMRATAQAIAEKYGLSLDDLQSPARVRHIAWPRQEAMAEMYATGRFSLPQIGLVLGGRHHTTILHGIRRHAERIGEGAA